MTGKEHLHHPQCSYSQLHGYNCISLQ